MQRLALTGAEAAAHALRQINPAVFACYPITPQTPIVEKFAEYVANGEVDTEFINVESEHSAMSAVVGAANCGIRATTATSSQGLALMFEILPIASGMRLPILMNVSSRTLSAPINIHCDHSDVMAVKDQGWIQIFCETPQEVYDYNFLGLRLAERMRLPAMIVQDGFITSHCVEPVEILDDKIVQDFIEQYRPKTSLLHLKNPKTFGPLALPEHQMDIKEKQMEAANKVLDAFFEIAPELTKLTGRYYNLFEAFGETSNEKTATLVALGSTAGTIKQAILDLTEQNIFVSLLRPIFFRPFPYKEIASCLSDFDAITVLDRSPAYGSDGSLCLEIKSSLYDYENRPKVENIIYGLGGRDFSLDDAKEIFMGMLKNQAMNHWEKAKGQIET